MFLIWLGEQIFARGVTDGLWLLFAASYVGDLPASVDDLIKTTYNDMLPAQIIPICAAVLIVLVAFLVEPAGRRLPEPDTASDSAKRAAQGSASFLVFRIDNTGVLAPTTASWLLFLLVTVSAFLRDQNLSWFANYSTHWGQAGLSMYRYTPCSSSYLCFFFTAMVVNPKQGSNGRRLNPAGEATERDVVLAHLTLIGALYLAILCIVPELMISFAAIPLYLGGTWLLVTVLVALNTLAQVRRR
jgi:preprotein translocase subunit SecY